MARVGDGGIGTGRPVSADVADVGREPEPRKPDDVVALPGGQSAAGLPSGGAPCAYVAGARGHSCPGPKVQAGKRTATAFQPRVRLRQQRHGVDRWAE
eukprot:scaffold33388_cov122-Isochrysis_galbana.AAC.3